MQKIALALVALPALLAGCKDIQPTIYYNAAVTQAQMQLDYELCAVEGARDVPVDRITSAKYDKNFKLRQNVIGRCMVAKGYSTAQLPDCGPAPDVDLSKPASITKNSCVAGNGSSYSIVSR